MKRTSEAIFERGGFIRKFENMGTRNLPFKISEHGLVHRIGTSFIIKFDSPPTAIQDLKEEYGRDVDVIRRHIFKIEEENKAAKTECTLSEEMKPPAYRKEVIEMMRVGKQNQKEKYPQKTGLGYYPFQK